MTTLTGPLADGAVAVSSIAIAQATAITEAWVFGSTFTYQVIPGGGAVGNFAVRESFALNLTRNASLTESFVTSSLIRLFRSLTITEHFASTDAYVAWVNKIIGAKFTFKEVMSTSFIYNLTIIQAIKLASTLDNKRGVGITEGFHVGAVQSYAFVAASQIVEMFLLSGVLTKNLVMRLALTEHAHLSDLELLQMIFNQTMVEAMVMEILYQSPNGNVTSWAINTRTNAVTQYENFAFNSFAQMGNKYLAADEYGLYELNGAQDISTPIVADFGGGYFQPGGAKFSGLKGVYIGAAGQGNYLLKIITGDQIERVYRSVLNPGMMTTKVNIGKGIRARYVAWELINEDGQDFDFDQIEFVPMLSGRRV